MSKKEKWTAEKMDAAVETEREGHVKMKKAILPILAFALAAKEAGLDPTMAVATIGEKKLAVEDLLNLLKAVPGGNG